MDDFDDLERRLAGRLRPARVPGVDETWRRLAPHLADHPRRRILPSMLPWAAKATGALALFLTYAVTPRLSPRATATNGIVATVPGVGGVGGPAPAGWRPVPLSPVVGKPRVVMVTDDPTERERACGPWDTTASLEVRYNGAVCVAFLVAENGRRPLANQIVSYGHWGEALAVFGLADIPGPPADRLVAIVRIGHLDGDPYAVILDAVTGAPYLIVWPG